MSTLLKNLFSPAFYDHFTNILEEVLPSLNKSLFIEKIFNGEWAQLELKARMRHTSRVLHYFMPSYFPEAAGVLLLLLDKLEQKGIIEASIEYMFLPDYVEIYGLDHPEESVRVMERLTTFTSCEFAIRPFLLKYSDRMLAQMLAWSEHEHYKVRRLASEGCRPRLPWAMALPFLKQNPAPILPILENLKADPADFVRRSVANNLNDISKDNPELALAICKKWYGNSTETNWIVKHACRTLLKQAHPEALTLFGYADVQWINVLDFELRTDEVSIGDALEFSFKVQNTSSEEVSIRLEYGLYYLRANGMHAKKVFKISERFCQTGESMAISRRQSFRIITTRRFYPGQHFVSLIINGLETEQLPFILTEAVAV